MKGLEFPNYYSQSACDIIASKYCRKKCVALEGNHEYSMKQVAHRMVSFWVEFIEDENLIIYDELVFMH